jgi:hypothetical protein
MSELNKNKETPADNEQIGKSGGITRSSGSEKHHLLAIVQTLVKPPPAPSRRHVRRQRVTVRRNEIEKL